MSSHTATLKRRTLLLGVVLALLSSGMIYQLWMDATQPSADRPDADTIHTIVIEREGFDDIRLTKIDDTWQVAAPCSIPVNPQRLTPLLQALAASAHQYRAGEIDLAAAGLSSPEAIVTIDGVSHAIGDTDLEGTRRYVQIGDRVQFAPDWILSLVNGGVTALARLDLFPVPLHSVSLIRNTGTQTLSSSAELERWQAISAQQIVPWPMPDMASTPGYQLHAQDTAGTRMTYTAYQTPTFTALQPEDAACAYILAPDTLPE